MPSPVDSVGSTVPARPDSADSTVPARVRKPEWLKVRAHFGPDYQTIKKLVRGEKLHTVCEEAGCPNIFECWQAREATFLIGGGSCTRRCAFCKVRSGKPAGLDPGEPERVAAAVEAMGLRFAVVTGVSRDDLEDGGAVLYAQTVRAIRRKVSGCGVEVLVGDFGGDEQALRRVIEAAPDVLGHNIETPRRLFRKIRPGFRYKRSLEVISHARAGLPEGCATKSGLMLGLGEEREEVLDAMRNLRAAGCDLITLSQYLQPTPSHLPVTRYVHPSEFAELAREGRAMGFAHVESGPLVRSSYHAGRQFAAARGFPG
ncbi:MAG: lipoyl synthase [Actinomycetota bacterium]